jgi:hypothetical protein
MDNYCCKNVDNVDKNMKVAPHHQIHDNFGSLLVGRGTQGRGMRSSV